MKALRRFDRGLARGESALATVVLIVMILVAAAQAGLRNLTNMSAGAANAWIVAIIILTAIGVVAISLSILRDRQKEGGFSARQVSISVGVIGLVMLAGAVRLLAPIVTNLEISWANVALEHMDWGDSFMQKCTLWLAFLGASLSTYDEKHIGIDVVHRIVKPRTGQLLRFIVSVFSGVTCFVLSRIFWLSVLNNAKEVPLEYSVLGETDEMVHLCEASAKVLADAELVRPGMFCAVRDFLQSFGADMSTPDIALQLIVPTMFLFMAVRFILRALAAGHAFITNQAPEPTEH